MTAASALRVTITGRRGLSWAAVINRLTSGAPGRLRRMCSRAMADLCALVNAALSCSIPPPSTLQLRASPIFDLRMTVSACAKVARSELRGGRGFRTTLRGACPDPENLLNLSLLSTRDQSMVSWTKTSPPCASWRSDSWPYPKSRDF